MNKFLDFLNEGKSLKQMITSKLLKKYSMDIKDVEWEHEDSFYYDTHGGNDFVLSFDKRTKGVGRFKINAARQDAENRNGEWDDLDYALAHAQEHFV